MEDDRRILLSHGSGGKEEEDLLKELFSPIVKKKIEGAIGLEAFDDGCVLPCLGSKMVLSTDNHTVKPLFFPGGNIGTLAAAGSINDVAVMGATPIGALNSIVVEVGYRIDDLRRIVESMVQVFDSQGVELLGGDFKVMPEGEIDELTINTTVIGTLGDNEGVVDSGAKPGDKVVISGTIGDHGATILGLQRGINVEAKALRSDCQPITDIMNIAKSIGGVTTAKDPTRGGVAMSLNEIAEKSEVMIEVDEEFIPIKQEVQILTDMLGVDVLSLTCEGRVLMTVTEKNAEKLVATLKGEGNENASIIGEVKGENPGYVVIKTLTGGKRIINKPTGEIVPRIC